MTWTDKFFAAIRRGTDRPRAMDVADQWQEKQDAIKLKRAQKTMERPALPREADRRKQTRRRTTQA